MKERERKSRKSDGGLHRVSDEKRECRQEEEQSGRKSQRRRMGGKENKRPCEHRDKFSTRIMRKMEGNAEELHDSTGCRILNNVHHDIKFTWAGKKKSFFFLIHEPMTGGFTVMKTN